MRPDLADKKPVLKGKKVLILSLGCKVNQYEADAMIEELEAAGALRATENSGADICLLNTCSVTNIADRKSRQMIHRLRRMYPSAVIAATGCYVQAAGDELLKDHAVDLIIGNNRKKDAVRILSEYLSGRTVSDNYIDVNKDPEFEDLTIRTPETHTRAYVKIQDGCSSFCTYCIIPYVRGRIKSKPLQEIHREVTTLADNGVKEVVLTGINLSSYDDDDTDEKLKDVIRDISEIPGIERIRLGSLEPRVITHEFLQTVSSLPNFCPHFHLSLQSACNRTLKRMNRHYTIEEFQEICQRIRSYYDRPALTTDIIVGFPGETEEDFEETKKNLKQIHFYEMHVFKYSRRKGTPADRMTEQIPEKVKAERSRILLEMRDQYQKEFEDSFRKEPLSVLIEEIVQNDHGTFCYRGHTERYILVDIPCRKLQDSVPNPHRINTIVRICP